MSFFMLSGGIMRDVARRDLRVAGKYCIFTAMLKFQYWYLAIETCSWDLEDPSVTFDYVWWWDSNAISRNIIYTQTANKKWIIPPTRVELVTDR